MPEVGVLIMHGVSDARSLREFKKEGGYATLVDRLTERIRRAHPEVKRSQIRFQPGFYSDILQGEQDKLWDKVADGLQWQRVRSIIFHLFSDATAYTNRVSSGPTPHQMIHERLRDQLNELRSSLREPETARLVIAVHSLGCQVISDLIWDATGGDRRPRGGQPAYGGIWKDRPPANTFESFEALDLLVTFGCNIPLFVSGYESIKAFREPSPGFQWHNFFDDDDVLGFPLQKIPSPRGGPPEHRYRVRVTRDHLIKTGLPPLSHVKYWGDRDMVHPMARMLAQIQQGEPVDPDA